MVYLKTPLKRRWLRSTLIVAILSLALVGLGFRQLHRHHERMAYIEAVAAEVEDTPFVLTGGPEDDAYAERIYHLVEASGHFDFDHQVLIKNQFYRDVMGYHLVTPFLIAGSDRAVLVDRGWIPPEAIQSPEDARKFDEPDLTHIVGRILPQEKHRGELPSPDHPQFIWYRVDVTGMAAQMPYAILPYGVALIPSPEQRSEPPYRNPPKFKLDPGPHFGYAIQWFLFAAALPLLYLWQVVRVDRKEENHF